MQDLSPSEIEALTKAIGNTLPGRTAGEGHSKGSHETTDKLTSKGEGVSIAYAQFSQLKPENSSPEAIAHFQQRLQELDVVIEVILGKAKLSIAKLLKIQPGQVIALDKLAGEKVDIEANGKLIAKGEVVIIDENFGIKILEIVDPLL